MKPKAFEYLRAKSIKEVVDALAQHGDDARVIAGGQSLVPMMNFRIAAPALLIDIRHVPELNEIRINGDFVEVGAAVTQNRLLAWAELQARLPLLAASMPWVGHFQTRNRGTVCGSLAHADPSSEIPLSLAMLEGEVVLASSRGTRTLKASEFQLGMLTTAKEGDELIVAAPSPFMVARRSPSAKLRAAMVTLPWSLSARWKHPATKFFSALVALLAALSCIASTRVHLSLTRSKAFCRLSTLMTTSMRMQICDRTSCAVLRQRLLRS